MREHAGKRCLITGGAAGIGAAMARRFSAEGAQVAILDRRFVVSGRREDAQSGEILEISADVTRHDELTKAMALVEKEWGGLDVILNNAGISTREHCLDVTEESWNQVINVNLTGAFFVAQAGARLMRQTKTRGVIINTASVSGMVGMPNYVSYNVSKAGIIEMTKTMALELAPYIRVNAICPGYILTDMQRKEYSQAQLDECASRLPSKRLGRPEEIAAMASFLSSSEAEFAIGQCFVIDGGETAGGLASA